MIDSVQVFEVRHIQGALAPDSRAVATTAATEGALDQSGVTRDSDMRVVYEKFCLDT
jgi:hypothetical protein